MRHTEVTRAHIEIPSDCLPLVAELVTRLGGKLVDDDGEAFPVLTMPEMERGGKMLRALRQQAKMTQKELAHALGVPQSHISDFEKNRRNVPYKHAQKLAEILHSAPSHFMTPNVETRAAMNESGEEEVQGYASTEALYTDLGI